MKRYLKALVLILTLPIVAVEVIRDNAKKSIAFAVLALVILVCAFMPEKEVVITDLSAAFNTGNLRTKTEYIVIHHTAGSSDANINAICQIHYGQNKWSTVGYHYYIDKEGCIYRLKSDDEVAPHTYGYNSNAIGIVCAGNFNNAAMPDAQYNALVALTKKLSKKYNIPTDRVKRHCDLNNTECPGRYFDVAKFVDDID